MEFSGRGETTRFHPGFPRCRAQAQPPRGLLVTKMSSCPEFPTWKWKTRTSAVVSGRILVLAGDLTRNWEFKVIFPIFFPLPFPVVADLQMAIFKLESRLNALEKSSTSHQPSPVPPTQVSLGKMLEFFSRNYNYSRIKDPCGQMSCFDKSV